VEEWVEHENTQVVQTAWATMALMYAGYPKRRPIEKGVKLVMSRQLPVRSPLDVVINLRPSDGIN
jgi:squalene cyclase